MTTKAEDLLRFMPADKRADLRRIAELAKVSIGAAIAMSLAAESIRDYCPPDERATVAGMLMVTYAHEKDR